MSRVLICDFNLIALFFAPLRLKNVFGGAVKEAAAHVRLIVTNTSAVIKPTMLQLCQELPSAMEQLLLQKV